MFISRIPLHRFFRYNKMNAFRLECQHSYSDTSKVNSLLVANTKDDAISYYNWALLIDQWNDDDKDTINHHINRAFGYLAMSRWYQKEQAADEFDMACKCLNSIQRENITTHERSKYLDIIQCGKEKIQYAKKYGPLAENGHSQFYYINDDNEFCEFNDTELGYEELVSCDSMLG
jgi:hypothetical protein